MDDSNAPPATIRRVPGCLQWTLAALGLFALSLPALAQHDVAAAQDYLKAANTAYLNGDIKGFTASLETAYRLNPASYYTRYNLACAYALSGRADSALGLLEQLADARVDYGMTQDSDLASLHELPRFVQLAARLEAATVPKLAARPHYSLDELGLIAEGIAVDEASGRVFFGSMRTGEVFVLDRHKQLARFARVEDGRPLAAVGMTVDGARGLLWVVGTATPITEEFDERAPPVSGVFGFDLGTGELQRRHLRHDSAAAYNDVAVGPTGTLYLSGDTLGVLAEGEETIRDLPLATAVFGSNGITLTPDARHLVVSSYPVGIAVVQLSDGAVRLLDAPENLPLYGIDGITWHDGRLLAVQNGLPPWRLMHFSLDDDLTAITAASTIEFGNPASTPTTVAISDGRILYVGQGPEPDSLPAHFPDRLKPVLGKTLIMTVPLD